jgi:hypothetical protein
LSIPGAALFSACLARTLPYLTELDRWERASQDVSLTPTNAAFFRRDLTRRIEPAGRKRWTAGCC